VKKVVVILTVGMLAGCSTVPLQEKYPKGALFCPKDTVEICEGRTPRDLECTCVNKRVLERQLRNINLY